MCCRYHLIAGSSWLFIVFAGGLANPALWMGLSLASQSLAQHDIVRLIMLAAAPC